MNNNIRLALAGVAFAALVAAVELGAPRIGQADKDKWAGGKEVILIDRNDGAEYRVFRTIAGGYGVVPVLPNRWNADKPTAGGKTSNTPK